MRDATDPRPDFDDVDITDASFVTHSQHHETSARHMPLIVPDHGRQPRRGKRPLKVVYDRDRANLYRPSDDPWLRTVRDAETIEERPCLNERWVANALDKTARAEAPKLSWRRTEREVADLIQSDVLPLARIIAAKLPEGARHRVLDQFVKVLRDEIAALRKRK